MIGKQVGCSLETVVCLSAGLWIVGDSAGFSAVPLLRLVVRGSRAFVGFGPDVTPILVVCTCGL